jgi:hypothetical protein
MSEDTVNVRYMVDDVDTAVEFYTTHFGFELRSNGSPAFADVVRGSLRLLLSGPKSSAGRAMPDRGLGWGLWQPSCSPRKAERLALLRERSTTAQFLPARPGRRRHTVPGSIS